MDDTIRYQNSHDAHMRLQGTICRYKGDACFVYDMSGELSVSIVMLRSPFPTLKVKYNSADLDVSSPPLGWCNPPERLFQPSFWLRNAARQQQQGLALGRVLIYTPRNTGYKRGWQYSSGEDLAFLGDMINDTNWPSIAQATLSNGMALNREWAIVRYSSKMNTFSLFHLDVPVGVYNPKSRAFVFAKDTLTKTRRQSINSLIYNAQNIGGYHLEEQA